jgi:hypothetical protein
MPPPPNKNDIDKDCKVLLSFDMEYYRKNSKTLTKMPKRSPLTIAIAARSFDLQSPESLTVQECYDILPCNYTNSTYFFFSFLGHIKKNRWLTSLAFAKKWAGGRIFFKFLLIFNALVLGPELDFIAQYRYFFIYFKI